MKLFLAITLLTSTVFATLKTFGQADTVAIKSFLEKQVPSEQKFIGLLKENKIDSCMMYLSSNVINKYGIDSLQKELGKLNLLLNNYPNLKNTVTIGQSYKGTSAFGHDSDGIYEKASVYQIYKKENVIYFFTLYYSGNEPLEIIQYYDSKDMYSMKPVEILKLTK